MEQGQWEHWEMSDEARESAQAYLDHLEATAPEFPFLQMRRLVGLAKAHLPPLTTKEAGWLVDFLCGFSLPFADKVPSGSIALLIADEIRETFVVNFGAEGLAEEKRRFGTDSEWNAFFRAMPEMLFADRIEELDSLQAYLAMVMTECYWQKRYGTGAATLSDFFTILD
jgi:hypothetical protein